MYGNNPPKFEAMIYRGTDRSRNEIEQNSQILNTLESNRPNDLSDVEILNIKQLIEYHLTTLFTETFDNINIETYREIESYINTLDLKLFLLNNKSKDLYYNINTKMYSIIHVLGYYGIRYKNGKNQNTISTGIQNIVDAIFTKIN